MFMGYTRILMRIEIACPVNNYVTLAKKVSNIPTYSIKKRGGLAGYVKIILRQLDAMNTIVRESANS